MSRIFGHLRLCFASCTLFFVMYAEATGTTSLIRQRQLIQHQGIQGRQGGRMEEEKQKEAREDGSDKSRGPFCENEEVTATLPFCIGPGYEKYIRPEQDRATHIGIKLKITEIEKVDDSNLTMTFHIDFEINWKEPRLVLTNNTDVWDPDEQEWITVDQELVDEHLWIPDVAVYNLKEFQMSWVLHPLASVDLYPDKTINYVFAARVTIGCNFFFESFPLDRQECNFYVGSYGHTTSEMLLNGTYIQLSRDKEKQRPTQYLISIVDLREAEKIYESRNEQGVVEERYSVIGFKVKMSRVYDIFLTRTYFPAALMVIVSFISYLIGQEEVVGRLALLVTLTLIEVNIMWVSN